MTETIMSNNLKQYQEVKEIGLAYNVAIHALQEYRLWRDNTFIGQQLGPARNAYLTILRNRVRDAIEAYKLVRATAGV
jgi:hypothetical protein